MGVRIICAPLQICPRLSLGTPYLLRILTKFKTESDWLLGYRMPGHRGPPLTQAEADRVDYRLSAARRLARAQEGDSDSNSDSD